MGLIVDMPTHTGALNGVKVPVAIPTSPHDEGDAVDLGRLCEKNTEAITANIADGATIPVGTVFPIGFTLTDYLKKKYLAIFQPQITEPTFEFYNDSGGIREIGIATNVILAFIYNRGSIYVNGVFQNYRAGAVTGYTFKQGDGSILQGQPQTTNIYTWSNYTVVQGLNSFKAKMAYAIGSQPKDSNNANVGSPLAAGESAEKITSFEGVYPMYASTVSIATPTKQLPMSMLTSNNIQLTLVAESGGSKGFFEIPATWLTARPLTAIQYFNPVSGQFDSANKIADFTVVDATHGSPSIAYKRYRNSTSDRGAITIKLIF